MILDDTAWFTAQKRITAEFSPVGDEMKRIYPSSVKSEFEYSVEADIFKWLEDTGGVYSHPTSTRPRFKDTKELIKAYWNERLN